MLEVIKAGGFTKGGLNFDAKVRRPSFDFEDIVYAYISGMDTFALGLIKAYEILEDGRIENFVTKRYESYTYGIGKEIVEDRATLESLEAYILEKGETKVESGRQELLESIFNTILFK